MNRITAFRLLLLLSISLYLFAWYGNDVGDLSWSPALHEYEQSLYAQFGGFRPEDILWILLALVAFFIEATGLFLLFCRHGSGIWAACLGRCVIVAVSWASSYPSDYPTLHTKNDDLLWAAACSVWGATICLAIVDWRELFGSKRNTDGTAYHPGVGWKIATRFNAWIRDSHPQR